MRFLTGKRLNQVTDIVVMVLTLEVGTDSSDTVLIPPSTVQANPTACRSVGVWPAGISEADGLQYGAAFGYFVLYRKGMSMMRSAPR
jgi:hypothetical protein